ncbi:hypothetical protein B0A48_05209 [Cryoendolithus antarcticus]|uniref:Uncharacterized protein n=1 Tax=Cryoendolithus antarcticus TaxID=1507870 RepID=A0A1V8TI39_9PEZI|nr:hypothetical protein B0A48_05209 [Cryoendolithus antarcticus]
MAVPPSPMSQERKRVKVYELKNNDWYDRGTGFCSGQLQPQSPAENPEAHVVVLSEDEPERMLLETKITKDDGYQKQQDTLIVWTESNGVDMALSFQEAEGCSAIWEFVSDIQTRLTAFAPDGDLSDDLLDPANLLSLPEPALGRLEDVENIVRQASATPHGREALIKFILSPEQQYILKLAPLVEMAEDLESLSDLHRLCTIMKHLILLNDSSIIEFVVTDQAIMGVVGALEYDPDFPSHRANHRQYLSDPTKFKQVVEIKDEDVRRRIHCTYRLTYLKDVVLARILDDPTFSVLNSLIFYNQVDIINFLIRTEEFLGELFSIFNPAEPSQRRKKEAVLFIKDCCSVSKTIQAQSRAQLYHQFIGHGLWQVVEFALKHHDAAVRVAGTDILVSLIDHDPHIVRGQIFNASREDKTPLTDTLIELLLIETDLGVKSQMADAIKVLLDPATNQQPMDINRTQNGGFVAKQRGAGPHNTVPPQTDAFISRFYENAAMRLFQPLRELQFRPSMAGMSVHETSLYTHLVEILCFFMRQHNYKARAFIIEQHLHESVARLLECPQKYIKLTALKWFRITIGLQDEFHNRQMIAHRLFNSVLDIVYETMPRDNLLNSACLELFEFVRSHVKQLVVHIVEHYRERLAGLEFVPVFKGLIQKYDNIQESLLTNGIDDSVSTIEGTPQRMTNGFHRFASGLKEADADEEAYFAHDDDPDADDDDENGLPTAANDQINMPNGASPARPLVPYSDDDEDAMDILAASPDRKDDSSDPTPLDEQLLPESPPQPHEADNERGRDRRPVPVEHSPGRLQSPPEPMALKRRREEDEQEDEIGKLMGGVKRRNSSAASVSSTLRETTLSNDHDLPNGVHDAQSGANGVSHVHTGPLLRRKGSLKTRNEGIVMKVKREEYVVKREPDVQSVYLDGGDDEEQHKVTVKEGKHEECEEEKVDSGGGEG